MTAINWTDIQKEYKGLWVALKEDEQTVVGSGKTLAEVLEKAKEAGYEKPIIVRMPERVLPFIGGPRFVTRKENRPQSHQLEKSIIVIL